MYSQMNSSSYRSDANSLIQTLPNDVSKKLSPECEKRNYLLKFTDQLYEKLGLIQDENKQELCEKYRQILQKLKTRLDTIRGELLEKCEKQLKELSLRINGERMLKECISNIQPVEIDLTVDEDNIQKSTNSNTSGMSDYSNIQPDSTVFDEEVFDTEINTNTTELCIPQKDNFEMENEVSSSGVNVTSSSPNSRQTNIPSHSSNVILLDKPYQKVVNLEQLERSLRFTPKQMQKLNEIISSNASEKLYQEITSILSVEKEKARKNLKDYKQGKDNNLPCFGSLAKKEEFLNKLLTILNSKSLTSCDVSQEIIDIFSENCTDDNNIAQLEWDVKVKSKINENHYSCDTQNNNLCDTSETECSESNNLIKAKLSAALEKLMNINENVQPPQPATTKLNTEKNFVEKEFSNSIAHTKSAEISKEGKTNIRGKLAQEIALMHKAGDGSKILGSLKKLKNDSKKIGNSSEDVIINPFIQKCVENQFHTIPKENDQISIVDQSYIGKINPRDPRIKNKINSPNPSRLIDLRFVPGNMFPSNNSNNYHSNMNANSFIDNSKLNTDPEVLPSLIRESNRSLNKTFVSKRNVTYKEKREEGNLSLKKYSEGSQHNHIRGNNTRFAFSKKLKRNNFNDLKYNKCHKFKMSKYGISTTKKVSNEKYDKNIKNREDIQQKIKEQTEYSSPLANIYPETLISKTTRNYGSSFNSKFKIPKVKKSFIEKNKINNEELISKANFVKNKANDKESLPVSEEIDTEKENSNFIPKKKCINSNFSNKRKNKNRRKKNKISKVNTNVEKNIDLDNNFKTKTKSVNAPSAIKSDNYYEALSSSIQHNTVRKQNLFSNSSNFKNEVNKSKHSNNENILDVIEVDDDNNLIDLSSENDHENWDSNATEIIKETEYARSKIPKLQSYETEENADNTLVKDEEFLARLMKIPSLREIIENTNLRGQKLYIHLLSELSSEQFKLVQEALKDKNVSDTNENNDNMEKTSIKKKVDADHNELLELKSSKAKKIKVTKKSDNDFDELEPSFTKESKSESENANVKGNQAIQGRNRKRFSELDRLHADIKKMKHTKNNIFTAIGTRSCRLQTPVYTDYYPKKETKTKKLRSFDRIARFCGTDDSSTDSEVEIRSGRMCRSKERNLDSESECDFNYNEKFKVSSDSGSDTKFQSKKTNKEKKIKSSKQMQNIYQKPCPKSVKIKLYGEQAMADSNIPCPELRVVLRKLSKKKIKNDVISESRSEEVINTNYSDDELKNNVSKANKDFENYAVVKNLKTVNVESNITSSTKEDNISMTNDKLLIDSENLIQETVNLEKSVINCKKNKKNVKKMKRKQIRKCEYSRKKRLTNKLNTNVSIKNLQDTLHDESSSKMEADINERISKLPERNALKDSKTSVNLMSIHIEYRYSKLLYKCSTNQCDYDTYDVKMFVNHLSFLHKDTEWNGVCSLCSASYLGSDLIDAVSHLMYEHLIMITTIGNPQISDDSQTVEIKLEPEEFRTSKNKLVLSMDNSNKKNTTLENNPCKEKYLVTAESCEKEQISENIVTSSELSSILPRIRVRRFSGDKLSGRIIDSTKSCEATLIKTELKQDSNNEEPFTFIISDVKTIPVNDISVEMKISNESCCSESTSSKTTENSRKSAGENPENVLINSQIQNIDKVLENVTASKAESDDLQSSIKTTTTIPNSNIQLNLDKKYMLNLYKCSGIEKCSFSTNIAEEFRNHLCVIHRQKKKRQRKVDAIFLKCLYCLKSFSTPELLIEHISDIHSFCHFQCPYCVFRACRPVYIIWHLQNNHSDEERKIHVLNSDCNREDVILRSDKSQSFIDVILFLKCTHGCAYETLSIGEFVSHIKKYHSQVQTLKCHICPQVCFKLDNLLKHYNLHHIAEFQCVYCLRGFASVDAMKSHLLQFHSFLYPKAIRRAEETQSNNDSIWTKYLINIDFDESINNLKNILNTVRSDDSVITLYRDDDSVTLTPVTPVNYCVLNKDNDCILNSVSSLKDGINERECITTELNNAVSAIDSKSRTFVQTISSSSTKPLPANITSSTELNLMPVETGDNKIITSCKLPSSKKSKKNNLSIIGLSGSDLYRCGMTGCSVAVEDYHSFKEHMFTCDNARNTKCPTCPHCGRGFLKNVNFFSHICLHGTPRYYCTICDFKYTTVKKVTDHMRTHKILKTKVIPANPLKDNKYNDVYLVIPDVDRKSRGPQKFVQTPTKKPPITYETTVISPIKFQITTVYSCDDIQKLGSTQLFTVPIGCGICNKYSTKVRTNILYHLKSHELGLTTNKDIVNPVPRMEKNELMFNKMTNHAAYTVKNDDKKNFLQTKIEKLDEADDGKKSSIIPDFVPKTFRFSCGAPGCNYVTQDGNGLKYHFETLHHELNIFKCPHCGYEFSTSKINSHFRYHNNKLYKCTYCHYVHYQRHGINKHQIENHKENMVSVQVIREMELDEVEKLNTEARTNFNVPLNKKISTLPMNCWKCNLCRCGTTATEELMKIHCSSSHRVNNKYKCCLCTFSNDNKEEVSSHLKTTHGTISQVIVTIYKEMNESEDVLPSISFSNSDGMSLNSLTRSSPLKDSNEENSTNTEIKKMTENIECDASIMNVEEGKCMFTLPYPDGNFKCPHCINFRTNSLEEMRDHIFAEENYDRYVCTVCGIVGVNKKELEQHLENEKTTHGETNENNIHTLTLDNDFEEKVLQALNYQSMKIKQMQNELKTKQDQYNSSVKSTATVIEIPDSSDDETSSLSNLQKPSINANNDAGSSQGNNSVSRKRSATSTSNLSPAKKPCGSTSYSQFTCSDCEKVFFSLRGLKYHYQTVHIQVFSKDTKSKKKQARSSYVEICRFCDEKFTSTIMHIEHSLMCSKRLKPIKKIKLSCDKCNFCTNNDLEFKDHSKIHENLDISSECLLCTSSNLTLSELVKHRRAVHETFSCLFCNKVLYGENRLNDHIGTSYGFEILNQLNTECIPAENKIVHILCPFCSFCSVGKTYFNYVEVSSHIKKAHMNDVDSKSDHVQVQIDNTERRYLTSREISYLQIKSTFNESLQTSGRTSTTVKRRNVAVKSTARIPVNQLRQQTLRTFNPKNTPTSTLRTENTSDSIALNDNSPNWNR